MRVGIDKVKLQCTLTVTAQDKLHKSIRVDREETEKVSRRVTPLNRVATLTYF